MNFFIWRKNNVLFSSYQDFCVFVKPADFKLCDVITSYTYAYFFWILSSIKMKFGQILVCCMKNLSNMFSTECWRLETSSRLFCDFIRKAIQQDLGIFNGWHIPFSIVLYSLFQKNETLESWYIWLLSNFGRLLIKKDLESSPSPPNCSKDYWKLLHLLISINWPSLVT